MARGAAQGSNPHHGRRRARRAAMQALYQWLVAGEDLAEIERQFKAEQEMQQVDMAYFKELLHRVPRHQVVLEEALASHADRPMTNIDPVERAVLLMGAYELKFRLDIPFRVVVDEAVRLAKQFGAQESYKYVNGLLDKLVPALRPIEHDVGL